MNTVTAGPDLRATYRLQLTEDLDFDAAAALTGRLAALGVSHLYLSPVLAAMPGSTHGYDWVPEPRISEALGGIDGLRRLRAAARRDGLGLIIDIVPNHVGVAEIDANPWFDDVLRRGRDSPFAHYFDIDFSPAADPDGRIPLPLLGDEADLAALELDGDRLRFYEHRLPIAPGTGDGDPQAVHDRQHYRLVPWHSGRIGYRRFFAINELAGLRQEDPSVYDATHAWLRELVAEDLIDGVRVDHPDGLADPVGYLQRLREDVGPDRFIFIEKILAHDEPLDPVLPVQGTTGYDQLRAIEALYTSAVGVAELDEVHHRMTGEPSDAAALATAADELKRSVLTGQFPTEHRRLVDEFAALLPDADRDELTTALGELVVQTDVYRADYPIIAERLEQAAARAADRLPASAGLLRQIVAAAGKPGPAAARLAQVTGAVTAKSIEDALFYRTARLVSAQEVGAEPAEASMTVDEFHEHNRRRAEQWPQAMTTTSTHDTKRGEDVRARIAVISQVPQRWARLVTEVWQQAPPPDGFTGYFLLQNIIGVWPAGSTRVDDDLLRRLQDYARKAMRESGRRTTWTEVNDAYEAQVADWVAAVTTGPAAEPVAAFVAEIAATADGESLARKAIAILGPGVPDIYQGTEWTEDSLVDPDNRRPVDYTLPAEAKTELVAAALRLRTDHPAAFGPGSSYLPIAAHGEDAQHVVAFARAAADASPVAVLVAVRLSHGFGAARRRGVTVPLPDGRWRDVLTGVETGGTVTIDRLLGDRPTALLERKN